MKRKFLIGIGLGMVVLLPAFGSTISEFLGAGNEFRAGRREHLPGTLVASTGVVTLTQGIGSVVNASGQELVFSTATGLNFFIQVTNHNQDYATDNLALVDARNFTGFTTSVGYLTTGGVAPSGANRTAIGDTVNFSFMDGNGQNTLGSLTPGGLGNTTDWLEIDTNATSFAETGSIGVQDGGTAAMLAFAPLTSPVPEPATAGLLCGGLALLGLVRKRVTG